MTHVAMFVFNPVLHDSRVLREARSLVRSGYKVKLIGTTEATRHETIQLDGIEILRLPLLRLPIISTSDIKFLRLLLYGLRILWYSIQVRNTKADIYHVHDFEPLLIGYLLSKRYHSKLVYDSHELYWGRFRLPWWGEPLRKLLTKLESFLAHRTDYVITVSHGLSQELSTRFKPKSIAVVRNISEISHTHCTRNLRRDANIPDDAKIIVHTGNLLPIKRRFDEIIMSMQLLPANIYLVFVGTGKLLPHLLQLSKQLNLSSRVKFLPPVHPHEVVPYIKGCDIGIVSIPPDTPSSHHVLPNKLFEYIAAALPIVSGNLPEVQAIVKSYDIGVIFHSYEPHSIAAAIKKALEPTNYIRFKHNIKKAHKELNWQVEQHKLLSVYENLTR